MRLQCTNCQELCTVEYSDNQSKIEFVCPSCGHISSYNRSVYPNPAKEDTDKQIDYILKDIERVLVNEN